MDPQQQQQQPPNVLSSQSHPSTAASSSIIATTTTATATAIHEGRRLSLKHKKGIVIRQVQSDVKKKQKKRILRRLSTLAHMKSTIDINEEEPEVVVSPFPPLSPAKQSDFDKKHWDDCKIHLEEVFASLKGKVDHGVSCRLDHIACCIRRADQNISQLQQELRDKENAMPPPPPPPPARSPLFPRTTPICGVASSSNNANGSHNDRRRITDASMENRNIRRMSVGSSCETPVSFVAPRRTPSFGRY